jgi:hypothetical protein
VRIKRMVVGHTGKAAAITVWLSLLFQSPNVYCVRAASGFLIRQKMSMWNGDFRALSKGTRSECIITTPIFRDSRKGDGPTSSQTF